jgi:transglutaminase-like putative cysteine protease
MWAPNLHIPSHTLGYMPEGRAGTFYTVRTMRELVRAARTSPAIVALARNLVWMLPPHDVAAEAQTLFQYVRDRIRYVRDVLDVETLATPEATARIMSGDCDDKSTLLAALFEAIGLRTRFVMAQYLGPDYEHVYLQVLVPDSEGFEQWITCDASLPGAPFGFEPPGATKIWHETV